MTSSWGRTIETLASDSNVRAVVVTGAGPAFCSGGDTEWLASEPDGSVEQLRDRMLQFYRTWLSIRQLEVPTIAAINGLAIGAGLCLPLACDLRLASDDAQLGAPFVKLGLHPGMAATALFPDVVGHARARDLLLTGRLMSAKEALEAGMVSSIHEPDQLLLRAVALAFDIAQGAPVAARLTKLSLARACLPDLDRVLRTEAMAQAVTLATKDFHEAVRARRERRTPTFHGF